MTLTVECTHSTVKPLNLHIQWLLAIAIYIQYNIYTLFEKVFLFHVADVGYLYTSILVS